MVHPGREDDVMQEPVTRAVRWRAAAIAILVWSGIARADEIDDLRRDLEAVKRQMQQMQETIRRQEELIQKLEGKPVAAPLPTPSALDRAVEAAKAEAPPPSAAPVVPPPAILTRSLGGMQLRLIDVSTDILVAAGASTERDEEIANLQGGGHDPNRRGFTLQQAEFSFSGAVDPYFTGEAHFVLTDSVTELEEAFLTTQRLPYGLQLEAGHFFTEFGRINPLHPHAWRWIDQPVINSRLFGPDGLRNPGVRLGWLAPLPWFSQLHLGAQNASGETAFSFLGEGGGGGHEHAHGEEEEEEEAAGIGGRPIIERDVRRLEDLLYLARWENAWTLTDSLSALVGGSGLFGPNATGPRERTRIYGADLVAKWRPTTNFRGWPFVIWESEVMKRDFEAGAVFDEAGINTVPEDTLYDWGLYSQLLYGFRYRWAGGLRYEYATGSGESVGSRAADPLRDDRHRIAPLLSFQPTEFSRLRLQYNFDHADHLDDDAHSVWLGFEILYGQHPAHRY
jgi:hypothetical protein